MEVSPARTGSKGIGPIAQASGQPAETINISDGRVIRSSSSSSATEASPFEEEAFEEIKIIRKDEISKFQIVLHI